ncbi:enolase C-terminal domain-like protein [Ottowia thiooxydans]|uniref:enolase C-terminal domain-like protein n=1 Tax=Ottowia thiooxydans TaxID=219182 RepID=UPI00041ACB0F|nr:enolase C-terminal domain-like protein [Ottowia thiooxydans]
MNPEIRLRVHEVEVREWPYRLRLPFRFGSVTKTHGRQVVLRARVSIGGRSAWGCAAESLSAKWFDKNPSLSDDDNHDQLRWAIESAVRHYTAQGENTAFGHAMAAHGSLIEEASRHSLGPLIAGYGAALLDRCVIGALGKLQGQPFWALMQSNLVGMQTTQWASDLAGTDLGRFLSTLSPQRELLLRHTVGLVDAITPLDQAPGSAVNDGLPETLEAVVATYRQRYFKIKVGGQLKPDLERLEAIAAVLDTLPQAYYVTLDGNEQFHAVEPVVEFLSAMSKAPGLRRFCQSLLWIEQPLARHVALQSSVKPIDAICPVIIDESDVDLQAFPAAIALGYRGVSSKICKGLYKSLINRARCEVRNAADLPGKLFMSAEDLTTLPGISLQQDLALVSLLGLGHVEKNAHHFVDGMRGRPEAEQRRFVQAHPDLYRFDTLPNGEHVARLNLSGGVVQLSSLDCSGFACAAEPDWDKLPPSPPSRWPDILKETHAR